MPASRGGGWARLYFWGLDKAKPFSTLWTFSKSTTAVRTASQHYQMALTIRLSRFGTKNEPHYRVAVAEARSRRDGDAVEYLGSYNPNAKGNPLTIKLDRFDYWVSKGAKPSDTVRSLVKRSKKAAAATA